jgi:ubiquinone/menaquinone biosynthesis C-methylase UbiE
MNEGIFLAELGRIDDEKDFSSKPAQQTPDVSSGRQRFQEWKEKNGHRYGEPTNPPKTPDHSNSLREKIASHPDVPPAKLLDLSDEEFRALSFNDYKDYLDMLTLIPGGDEIVAKHIDAITDRFVDDTDTLTSTGNIVDREDAMDYGNTEFKGSLQSIALSDVKISGEAINRLFNLIHHTNPLVRHYATETLDSLVVLDNRNRNTGEYLHLADRFVNEAIEKLTHPQKEGDIEIATEMIDVAWGSFPSLLPTILLRGITEAPNIATQKVVLNRLANRLGLENVRKQLRRYAEENPSFKNRLDTLEQTLLGGDRAGYADLAKLYNDINFKEYKPNAQLNEYETDLLLSEFGEEDTILDIASGPGRLLHSLTQRGRKVVGFDFVREHIKQIKEINPEAEVFVASWHAMPFQNQSIDGAYCLGRSFLHNTTVEDGLQFLREAHRVLKEDGKLIIDLPDPDKGQYAEERKRFSEMAQKLGVVYFEDGSLNDSPDHTRYFDRLAPLPEQFKAMAALTGFKAEVMTEHTYEDTGGEENSNMYWRLTKSDDIVINRGGLNSVRTGSAPLYINYL